MSSSFRCDGGISQSSISDMKSCLVFFRGDNSKEMELRSSNAMLFFLSFKSLVFEQLNLFVS